MSGAGLLGVAVFSTIRPLSRCRHHTLYNMLLCTVIMQEVRRPLAAAGAGAGADAGGEPRHVPAALLLQPAHKLQHHLHRTVALAVHSHDDNDDGDDDGNDNDDDGRYEEICHEQCGNNTLVIDSVRLQTEALTLITEDNDLDAVEYLVREASIIVQSSSI